MSFVSALCSLLRIRELGIQSRENAKLYATKPTCGTEGQNFGSVRLIDCYAVWLVLGYGCATSLMILILEFITKKKMRCFSNEHEPWSIACTYRFKWRCNHRSFAYLSFVIGTYCTRDCAILAFVRTKYMLICSWRFVSFLWADERE